MDAQLSQLSAQLEEQHWWFTARAEILSALSRRIVPSPAKVVEVGCGTGAILGALPEEWRRVGVDTSAEAVAIAAERFPGLELSVGLAPGAVVEELREADLVLFCDVLEHIEEDLETFASVVQELPMGARVLITVPAWMELWSAHDEVHHHFRRYDQPRLERLWQELPMRALLVSPFNWRLYPLVRLFREVGRRMGGSKRPATADLFLPPAPVNAMFRGIFRSERGPLLRALDGGGPVPKRKGVSWLAILERS